MIQDIDISWIFFVYCHSGNFNSTVLRASVRRRPNKLNYSSDMYSNLHDWTFISHTQLLFVFPAFRYHSRLITQALRIT